MNAISSDERNRDRDDQTRPDIIEEEHEHDDDEHDAAKQIVRHRPRRERDEIAAVVERNDLHVLRQHVHRSALASLPRRACSTTSAPARRVRIRTMPSTASF